MPGGTIIATIAAGATPDVTNRRIVISRAATTIRLGWGVRGIVSRTTRRIRHRDPCIVRVRPTTLRVTARRLATHTGMIMAAGVGPRSTSGFRSGDAFKTR